MNQAAFKATVEVEGNEYEVPINKVGIEVDPPVFWGDNNKEYGFTFGHVRGLPVQDPDMEHDLNDEYGVSEDDQFLVKDGSVRYVPSDKEVVLGGGTDYQGYGEDIEVRIPEKAVELEWSRAPEPAEWMRRKHLWEPVFGRNILEEDATFDHIAEEEPSADEEFGKLIEEFASRRPESPDKMDVNLDQHYLYIKGVGQIVMEADCLSIGGKETRTVIRDPDPNRFSVEDDPYDNVMFDDDGWDTFALPGAFEGMGDGPFFVYNGEEEVIVFG